MASERAIAKSIKMVYVQPFYWAVTNGGVFQGDVFFTRRAAIRHKDELSRSNGHTYYEIRKITIQEVTDGK
jgi:hypothetical protein